MDTNSIKNKIAWKIYFVWLFKRVIPLFVMELVFLVLAFWLLGKLVFVQQVFTNAFLASVQNPFTVAAYLFNSFMDTDPLKQIVVVVLLGLGVLFMRDIGRALISYSTTSRVAKQK